ncbi:hypothetical protein KL933_003850 [Ogataea haglerorum]|uniref:F-box protein Hrt3/FBXO9 C-terminal domain-containing protein n=1 Tax=Ogataea haglerorum TaxID=1937702 RepID=A0AAN6D466_9ASCO|nr:uncharacterized protein KL911_002511 [Ogataea haglerorum]KAG7716214.1 hypothetical protein KL913_003425 [Ogataea haglerorum]KAG7717085.1 hypothetical protein KL949_003681 [Ogataea haglerorum]KAG7725802.1 hypothetical protein KL933_003850 [Ogataea haglerorum]KAG7731837.1 hypothetical protein KL948_002770 [Ogataea haglerorum]KAG7738997.1 hypothetical protein KL923_002797 [Ogataea haglerorum]
MSNDSLEESLKYLTLESIRQHPTKTKEDIALEFFELGSNKEQAGSLSEAIDYYRKAYKLDEKVDLRYRENLVKSLPTPERRKDGSVHNGFTKLDLSKIKVKPLLESFHDAVLHPIDEDKPIWLETLPDEVISNILEILICSDTPSWFNFAMSCRKLAWLGFGQAASWRRLCMLVYPKQVYDDSERVLNGVTADQWQMVRIWDHSWHKMLSERPFIKYNGLYISVVNYQREGGRSEFSNQWNLPFRMITYYRYYRFFPDGSCQKLLTIMQPQEVVPKFYRNWRQLFGTSEWERVYEGTWSMTVDGHVRCHCSGPVPMYTFVDEFQIVNGGKYARHHKLNWKRMGFVNKETLDEGDLDISNERSFAFSRVKSYSEHETRDFIEDTHSI